MRYTLGIHMEKGGETMEVIGDVTTAGERDTGYDASEKLDELIRLMHEGNARLAVWADTHLMEEEMGHMIQYLHAHADPEAYTGRRGRRTRSRGIGAIPQPDNQWAASVRVDPSGAALARVAGHMKLVRR